MSELQKKIKEKELKLIKEFLHSVTFRKLPFERGFRPENICENEDMNKLRTCLRTRKPA